MMLTICAENQLMVQILICLFFKYLQHQYLVVFAHNLSLYSINTDLPLLTFVTLFWRVTNKDATGAVA